MGGRRDGDPSEAEASHEASVSSALRSAVMRGSRSRCRLHCRLRRGGIIGLGAMGPGERSPGSDGDPSDVVTNDETSAVFPTRVQEGSAPRIAHPLVD